MFKNLSIEVPVRKLTVAEKHGNRNRIEWIVEFGIILYMPFNKDALANTFRFQSLSILNCKWAFNAGSWHQYLF